MWDSIFVVVNYLSEKYKKKDLFYLVNSRLKKQSTNMTADEQYNKKILFHQLSIKLKKDNLTSKNYVERIVSKNNPGEIKELNENDYRFRPWVMLKYDKESIFILKKINEKFNPWVSFGVTEPIYQLNYSEKMELEYDSILILIHRFNNNYDKLIELFEQYQSEIMDSIIDINLLERYPDNFLPWLRIKYSRKGVKLAKELMEFFGYMITIKGYKSLFEHNIPKEYKEIYKWSKKHQQELSSQLFQF